MVVKHITEDAQFYTELDRAGPKLVVADFFATWCGPCRQIAPHYETLSERFAERADFLKVDVDVCSTTAGAQGVSAMPTFNFYINKQKVDSLRGADPSALEQKIQHWAAMVVPEGQGGATGDASSSKIPPGQMDLTGFLTKPSCECLNESNAQTLAALLDGNNDLVSDCDEQLILNLAFNQPVKLHSILLKGPKENGPKTVKLYVNVPHTLDFDKAEITEGVQTLEFSANEISSGDITNLRYVKFQNLQNLQMFVADNVGGTDVTTISQLRLYGTPINATNMQDFKRVSGKKGEAHA